MRQSFAWWSFTHRREVEPASFLRAAVEAGVAGVEMLPRELWPQARDAGLELATGGHGRPEQGFNDATAHEARRDEVRRGIDDAGRGGPRTLIVFSGNRLGHGSDEDAIAVTAEGLAPVAAEAEAAGVSLVLELLNSKVDHPGYQCDRTAWGAEAVRRVGSPALRLLYDAYHMQLMEGDLSRTIKANIDLIGHVHTAGAPGRRDLDDRQEVNWRGIGGLLRHLGYTGWIGHEFIPRGDPVAALRHAIAQFRDEPA